VLILKVDEVLCFEPLLQVLILKSLWAVVDGVSKLLSGATSYYHADGLGSVTSLSNAAGAIAQTYTFDSFGKQTASSGSMTNPFRYTAREFDTETSLYYYRARYYDSTAGRFISEDPIGLLGGVNFYGYVGNDPADWVDIFGLQKCDKKKSCGVKKLGYDKTGTVPNNTKIHMHAEFLNDETHDPNCCEIRQFVFWNQAISNPGFKPPYDQPGNWYEDRDRKGKRYGYRAGDAPGSPGMPLGPGNSYSPDGSQYDGTDWPTAAEPIPGLKGRLLLVVVDVCNGGRWVAHSNILNVDMSRERQ
jgi:RHS repeat-associated protein